jgi:hypothetical protein
MPSYLRFNSLIAAPALQPLRGFFVAREFWVALPDFIQCGLDSFNLPGLMLNLSLYGMSHKTGTRPFRGFGKHVEFTQNVFIELNGNRLCHGQDPL